MTISDPKLSVIVEGTSTGGLTLATAGAVHHVAHLLLAARTLDDISVFANPEATEGDRLAVQAHGKWAISFVMSGTGPDDLRLERLAKSWLKKPHRSSRRRRQGKP